MDGQLTVKSGAIFLILSLILLLGGVGVVSAQNDTTAEGPTAEFEYSPSNPTPDEEVVFDASSSEAPAGEIASYDWEFEEATGISEGYYDETEHSWSERGEYAVTLEVTDNNGNTDSVSKTINIDADDPTADFEYSPSNPAPDEEVVFDASSSEAPAGEIASYDWEFEEATGTSEGYYDETEHSWSERGEYAVTLEVTDNGGATDSVTKTINVNAEGPTADFEYSPSNPTPDEEVAFDASSSEAPAGEIESYDWEFEEATGTSEGYYDETEHSWSERGEYAVTLEVTDNGGATDSVTKNINVSAEGPNAAFEYSPSTPDPDEEVSFDASTSEAPAGEIESYDWEFEGATGTSEGYYDETEHSWNERGEYAVTLEVTDNGGASDTVSKKIEVGNTKTGEDTSIPDPERTMPEERGETNTEDATVCQGTPRMSRTSVTTPQDRITTEDPAVVEANFRVDPNVPEECDVNIDLEYSFVQSGFQFGGGSGWEQSATDILATSFTNLQSGEIRSIDAEIYANGAEQGDEVTVVADYEIWYEGNRDDSTQQSGVRQTVDVEGVNTLENTSNDDTSSDNEGESTVTIPGFGIITTLLAFAGVISIIKRRLTTSSA